MSSEPLFDANGPLQPGNTEADFKKFDAYPWGSDRKFLQVLDAMVGANMAQADRQQLLGIALLGRIFYYQGVQKVNIDRTAYEAYLERNPSAFRPDPPLLVKIEYIREKMKTMQSSSADSTAEGAKAKGLADVPSWQSWAPTTDLGQKADRGAAQGSGGDQGAPYPEQFNEIIEAVTSGKDVPGIREIPNTIIRQKDIAPKGKMAAPRKPWEKQQPQETPASAPSAEDDQSISGHLDEEFPALGNNEETPSHQ